MAGTVVCDVTLRSGHSSPMLSSASLSTQRTPALLTLGTLGKPPDPRHTTRR